MAHYVDVLWQPEDVSSLGRRDRAPGYFRAYVPDELDEQLPEIGREARQAAEDALGILARADERIGERGRYLNHLLIRSESISSSWIEGNRVTPKKLAIAELLKHGTRVALNVVANVRATEEAIGELGDPRRTLTVHDIEDVHHIIEPKLQFGLRSEQNWVGGPGWSPLRAEFVPPPASEVPRLVDNLARFVSATDGNPVVRAAIAHAQFETIHPFIDGNGRTGRALIHTVLRRADALRNTLIPISTVFAGNKDRYIAGLTAYREIPPRLDDWIIGFSEASALAADNAVRLAAEIAALDVKVREDLIRFRQQQGLTPATPRSDAVVLRILSRLAEDPVLTVAATAAQHSVSPAAAHRALVHLADAGILGRTKDHKGKLICWTADQHLALVSLTERSNRVGAGDTGHRRPQQGPPAPPV